MIRHHWVKNPQCGFTVQIVRILVKRILYDFYQLVQLLDVQGLTLFGYRTGGTWWTGILEYWMKIINLTVCTRFTLLNYRQDRNDQEFEILIAIVNSILYSKLHCSLQNRIKVIRNGNDAGNNSFDIVPKLHCSLQNRSKVI